MDVTMLVSDLEEGRTYLFGKVKLKIKKLILDDMNKNAIIHCSADEGPEIKLKWGVMEERWCVALPNEEEMN